MSIDCSFPNGVRDLVDLRSDTVTRPPPEMLEAMVRAPVGDDVLGDDPTVAELERLAASMTGKEAALFVPSGTMGNQIAVACHTQRGEAILVEEDAHVLFYEVGGTAAISGVVSWTLPSDHGVMDPDAIRRRITKANLHTPGTTLLCLENTHNRAGGTIIPLAMMAAYRALADEHGLKIHLDGARVFNAAVALGVDVRQITRHVDSVNFCLSKGLRAPVGSLLCGRREFIDRARIWRKRLGGGMRQSGLLAACGLVSLNKMIARLAEDHARAARTAEAIAELPGLKVDRKTVQTNMVILETERSSAEWVAALAREKVLCLPPGPNKLRLMFHADVDDEKTDRAIAAMRKVAGGS
jgi:threonine aldolase